MSAVFSRIRSSSSAGASDARSSAASAAWRASRFRNALGSRADDLLVDARERKYSAGSRVHSLEMPTNVLPGLVVHGLARIYTMSAQGRQVTLRYCRAGDVLGLSVLIEPLVVLDGAALYIQAVTPLNLLCISQVRLRKLVSRDANNMWGLFTEFARALLHSTDMITQNIFSPVRSRVARHLLDLAENRGEELVVQVSQQGLANAIGSVREVVQRAIVNLCQDGLIARQRHGYVIQDPERLLDAARSFTNHEASRSVGMGRQRRLPG